MAVKVGINGFGRIGRLVMRAAMERKDSGIEVVAINDLGPPEANAHLLKHDTVHGRYPGEIKVTNSGLSIDGKNVQVTAERDPTKLPWGKLGVDVVAECTGIFTKRSDAEKHIAAGAKRVLISAPATDEDITVCFGVNEDKLAAAHKVISNASCTTNCLAPVAKVLQDTFGITKGSMTTIHAYTNDQVMLDFPHSDLRRARAGALSMIPTSTGAAKAIYLAIPELKGKLDGFAVRVPVPNVSAVDLVCEVGRNTTVEEVNGAMKKASEAGPLKGYFRYTDEELVSSDFKGDAASSTLDAKLTRVLGGNLVKTFAWYDNEWGYSNRVVDLIKFFGKTGL